MTILDKNLAIWSKMVIEDTAMMVSTKPNLRRPSLRCNDGVVHFGSVKTKNPICDKDWPIGVLIF